MKTGEHYLLRKGMMIRKHHAKLLFGQAHLEEAYPEFVMKRKDGSLQATEKLLEHLDHMEIPYDLKEFEIHSPQFYNHLVTLGKKRLTASEVSSFNELQKQIERGFKSGLLKYDTRGYYLSSRFDGR